MPFSPTVPRFPPKPASASVYSSTNISTQESKSQPRMSILAVGSVAFDTITTPTGHVDNELGGAATYFGLAASYFAPVRIVAVVGDDFTELNVFEKFQPRIPKEYGDSEFVFLGNIHPTLQSAVCRELPSAKLVGG